MISHAFTLSYNSHDKFKKISNKSQGKLDSMKLDEKTINSHDMSRFYEYANISVTKYVANINTSFWTRLRIDMSCCS